MQIFRYAEQGSISCCGSRHQPGRVAAGARPHPAASSARPELFVVVQDLFLTETARLADVVLPAAAWGEKLGTFTNADRTVHLSEKAVDPPGEARPDLDIFLDYARPDGVPGPRRRTTDHSGTIPSRAFEAWKRVLARPAVRLHRHHLRPVARRQRHPVAVHRRSIPTARERLYTDGRLQHRPRRLRDLRSRPRSPAPRHARPSTGPSSRPGGRSSTPPSTSRRTRRPTTTTRCCSTTGRTVYHFHTRTKTGRAPQLAGRRAGRRGSSCSPQDADRLGVAEGDRRRGRARAAAHSRPGPRQRHPARRGVRAVPLRLLGLGDRPTGRPSAARAANELTLTDWDPVSKQPMFKVAAVQVVTGHWRSGAARMHARALPRVGAPLGDHTCGRVPRGRRPSPRRAGRGAGVRADGGLVANITRRSCDRSSIATARGPRTNQSGCTRRSFGARGRAAWRWCATCTTCTSWPPSAM